MSELQGIIHTIFPKETFGHAFTKRVFWLTEFKDKYPQTWALELWHDDTDDINKFRVGDAVKVTYEPKGKLWSKNGKEGVITSLRCVTITQVKPGEVLNEAEARTVQEKFVNQGTTKLIDPPASDKFDDLPF